MRQKCSSTDMRAQTVQREWNNLLSEGCTRICTLALCSRAILCIGNFRAPVRSNLTQRLRVWERRFDVRVCSLLSLTHTHTRTIDCAPPLCTRCRVEARYGWKYAQHSRTFATWYLGFGHWTSNSWSRRRGYSSTRWRLNGVNVSHNGAVHCGNVQY